MFNRLPQLTLVASTLAYSWLGMQVVHELGHVVGAFFAGETVQKVFLHPLTISRTEVSHENHPLLVIWSGPGLGVALPIVLLAIANAFRSTLFYLFQFFAGFCLIANGVYIGIGSIGGESDAGDLLRDGSPMWSLIIFGLVCAPTGFWLWNGLGSHFGLGKSKSIVDPRAVRWAIGVVLAIVVIEILSGSR